MATNPELAAYIIGCDTDVVSGTPTTASYAEESPEDSTPVSQEEAVIEDESHELLGDKLIEDAEANCSTRNLTMGSLPGVSRSSTACSIAARLLTATASLCICGYRTTRATAWTKVRRAGFALLPSYVQNWLRNEQPTPDKLLPTSALDGLRGIAAVIVLHFHIMFAYQRLIEYGYGKDEENTHIVQLPFVKLIYAGHFMVTLFFVVGGYVISLKPIKLMRSHLWEPLYHTLVSSVFRRGLRLYLPGFIASFITMLTVQAGLWEFSRPYTEDRTYIFQPEGHPGPMSFGAQFHVWLRAAMEMTNVFSYNSNDCSWPFYNPYDPHLWTIQYEFLSSLVVFLVLLAFSRCHTPIRLVAVLAFMFWAGFWIHWEVVCFLSGTLLAEVNTLLRPPAPSRAEEALELPPYQAAPYESSEKPRRFSRLRPILSRASRAAFERSQYCHIPLFVFGLYLGSAPNLNIEQAPGYYYLSRLIPSGYWIKDPKRFLHTLGSMLLVFTVPNSTILQVPFLTRPAQYLGKISYSFYIVHGPLVHIVGFSVTPSMWKLTGMETTGQYCLGLALGSLVLALCVFWTADVFWRLVDCNCVRFSKWVEKKCFVKLV